MMNKDDLKKFIETNPDNYGIQLKRQYPLLFSEIDNSYSFDKFSQKLYHFIYGDEVGKCEICNNICKFDGIHVGYRKRCSCKCLAEYKHKMSNEIRRCVICRNEFEIYKIREKTTCSSECLLKLNSTSEVNNKRIISLQNTMMKKYGVNHISKIDGFGDKVKRTKLLNHGNANYVNIEKSKETKLKKYNNVNYNNIDEWNSSNPQ